MGDGSASRVWRDRVSLPRELLSWTESDECTDLFDEVRSMTGAKEITVVTERRGLYFLEVVTHGRDAARAAVSLLELHISHQTEYQARMKKHQQLQSDLEATNEEFDLGLRVEFSVPRDLLGLVIGKGGVRVNQVKAECGVERIVVDPRTSTVRIKGSNADAVAQARSMLDYVEENVKLEPGTAGIVIGEGGKTIRDMRTKSGCMRLDVEADEDGNDFIRILGTRPAVALAKTLVKTHLKYNAKFSALRSDEDMISRRLAEIDVDFQENARPPARRGGYARNQRPGRQVSSVPQNRSTRGDDRTREFKSKKRAAKASKEPARKAPNDPQTSQGKKPPKKRSEKSKADKTNVQDKNSGELEKVKKGERKSQAAASDADRKSKKQPKKKAKENGTGEPEEAAHRGDKKVKKKRDDHGKKVSVKNSTKPIKKAAKKSAKQTSEEAKGVPGDGSKTNAQERPKKKKQKKRPSAKKINASDADRKDQIGGAAQNKNKPNEKSKAPKKQDATSKERSDERNGGEKAAAKKTKPKSKALKKKKSVNEKQHDGDEDSAPLPQRRPRRRKQAAGQPTSKEATSS